MLKNIYCIVGVSGSGKTTIATEAEERFGLRSVCSYTTRPPRFEGETGHLFVTDEEFNRLPELCAYTEFAGYRYGVPSEMIDNSDIYVIDVEGVKYLREMYHGSKGVRVIGITVPPIDSTVKYSGPEDFNPEEREVYRRMLNRGDSEEKAESRVNNDRLMFKDVDKVCDCKVDSSNIDEAVNDLMSYILYQEV